VRGRDGVLSVPGPRGRGGAVAGAWRGDEEARGF